MRAIAALMVVFAHAAWKGAQYSDNAWEWFHVGSAGVDLFFIISGFIMCQTTFGKNVGFSAFMKARIMRIIPLYWALSLCALAIYLVMPDKVNSSGGTVSIFHSFTLLPTSSKYLIQTGWTLSYEFFFYFIFGFGLLFATSYKHLISIFIIFLLVSTGYLIGHQGVWPNFMTNPILLEFTMGIAAFHLLSRYKLGKLFSALSLLIGISLLVCVNVFGAVGDRSLYAGIPCLFIFIGLFGFENTFLHMQHHWFSRLLKIIGDSSYSLYLSHPFALVMGAMTMKYLGLTAYGHVFVLGIVAGATIAAILCYKLVEIPLSRLVKNADKLMLRM